MISIKIKLKIIKFSGKTWHKIQPPKFDSQKNEIFCSDDCSLHFQGKTNSKNSIYSKNEAPGIILAIGNTGDYLQTNENNLNTYMSRDGGHNWEEIRKKSSIYEIGNHGNLLVIG